MEIIYEDKNIIAVNKKSGISVYRSENDSLKTKSLIDDLIRKSPTLKEVGLSPRYGIIHRLDKNTSGVVLIAKNNSALEFIQKQFAGRNINKKYLTLVSKKVKNQEGIIHTFIGRNPQNRLLQQAFELNSQNAKKKGLREAVSNWRVVNFLKISL